MGQRTRTGRIRRHLGKELTHRLELIEWEDSYGASSSWQEISELDLSKPLIVRSVGWVVAENDERVVIVPHLTESHDHARQQGCGDMTIPKSAIRSRSTVAKDSHGDSARCSDKEWKRELYDEMLKQMKDTA